MNDIKFAKLHAGETFCFCGEEVKIVGYGSVGCGASVIVEGFSKGWSSDALVPGDVILCPPAGGEYVRYWYMSEHDLCGVPDDIPVRILIIGAPGKDRTKITKRVSKDYRLPIAGEVLPSLDHIPDKNGVYVSYSIDPVEAAKRKDEFKLIIIM